MLNIPIDQIARHMETHRNQPIPFEYAEILMGGLQQAHREGWEHAKREADSLLLDLIDVVLESKPVVQSARRAIAAMEYGGKAND